MKVNFYYLITVMSLWRRYDDNNYTNLKLFIIFYLYSFCFENIHDFADALKVKYIICTCNINAIHTRSIVIICLNRIIHFVELLAQNLLYTCFFTVTWPSYSNNILIITMTCPTTDYKLVVNIHSISVHHSLKIRPLQTL